MSLARLVVTAVRVEGRSKAEVSRDYGVSPRWVYELVRRFDAHGEAGLEPRSRRPHRSPARTAEAMEQGIVELRKELEDQGLDAGAHTIAYHLSRRHPQAVPSVATVWRILSRRGFITPQPQKRPRSSFIRFEASMPNERWQADLTHWKLADGTEVEILNVIDDHSRFLTASVGRTVFKAADVVATFGEAAAAHGFPSSLLTDNGAVFTSASRNGRCVMENELDRLGIRFVHSSPYHPQTCGKVERFHQTLKRWLAKQESARTVAEQQVLLDRFRAYYNRIRPHRAIGRRTPEEAFNARPKAGPTLPGFTVPRHFRVRRDKIDITGVITLRHDSRLHHIGLGRRLTGTRVLVLVDDMRVRVLTEDGELIRELTLDPTRDYQPHGRT
ncbi:MAG TPA: IS481 family transposase [Actinomycetota bacterium]|nr:IS481 family transposase [Actinomycetota bacterium]